MIELEETKALAEMTERMGKSILDLVNPKTTSRVFVWKYALSSASSVNSAVKGLLEKGLLNCSRGVYQVYDMFFATWLTERYMK